MIRIWHPEDTIGQNSELHSYTIKAYQNTAWFVSVAGKCLSLHETPQLTLLENHQSNMFNNVFASVEIQLDLGTKRPSANCAIPGGISVDAALLRI